MCVIVIDDEVKKLTYEYGLDYLCRPKNSLHLRTGNSWDKYMH